MNPILAGILIWIGIMLAAWVGFLFRRRRRKSRAQKTPEDVWNETDPQYRRSLRSRWPWNIGSGP